MKHFLRSIVFSICLLNGLSSFSQEPSRFPILPGSVWRINYEYSCWDEEFVHQSGDQEYKYFVSGDTLIAGKTYFKLYKSGILYLDTPVEINGKYMGSIRDSANRFYFVEEEKPAERLIYNFDAKVGEPICQEPDGMEYFVGNIEVLEGGRKKFSIDAGITVHCGPSNTIVEGVGWLGGLLEGNSCYSHPGVRGSYLLCYSENGAPVYNSDRGHRCGAKMVCSTDIVASNKPAIPRVAPELVLRNNRNLEICLNNGSIGIYNIAIYGMTGQKMKQELLELPGSINVSGLRKGNYVIRIVDGQTSVTAKFVIQ